MKKLFIIALIIMVLSTMKYNNENTIVIPNDAIRFRVVASSNDLKDQKLKKEVANNLQKDLVPLISNVSSKQEGKNIIENNMKELKLNIENTLGNNDYEINYGINHFPEKTYKGVKYPEGDYESLVVTLGNGLGKNFWCVLFPPLCLLEGEEEKTNEIEYQFFVKELINKYFK